MKNWFRTWKKDERGIGVVEIILILVVLIALVIIFRNELSDLVESIFGQIGSDSNNVLGTSGSYTGN